MNLNLNTLKVIAGITLSSVIFSCENVNEGFNPVSIDTFEDQISDFELLDLEFNPDNDLQASFTPFATNAVSFEVLINDQPNPKPISVAVGERITYDFMTGGSFDINVVATSLNGNVEEFSTPIAVAVSPPYQETFESIDGFFGFGVELSIVNNPFPGGSNPDENDSVLQLDKSGPAFGNGIGFDNGSPLIDFALDNKSVSVNVYSTKPVPVSLIFQNSDDGEPGVEVVGNHGGTGWEIVTLDFGVDAIIEFPGEGLPRPSIVPTSFYSKFVMFINGPSGESEVFYLDDIIQEEL